MLVIGLTGGIGSGKSTVANLFSERGVPIIDADVIAKEITQPQSPATQAIRDHFGDHILKNGALDRSKLRHIIFSDPAERYFLETLLHPLIIQEISEQIKKLTAPYVIAVIPLLLEAKHFPLIDRILVVDTPEHLQIARVSTRDQVDPTHIKAILDSQVNRTHRLSKAGDLIVNDGVIADLIPQVETLHQKYLKLSKTL